MKKTLQKVRLLTAVVAAATLTAGLSAYAAPVAEYNAQNQTISVSGVEEGATKASLIVFSPKYNLSNYSGIEYFDVQDVAADGSFDFTVPELSAENLAIGDYICRVDVFGGEQASTKYTLDVYYPYAISGLKKLVRFDYDTEGDTISATAWFNDTWQLNPNYRVIIGLYKDGALIDVAVEGKVTGASGATGWLSPLTATIDKNTEADTMKAFLLDISQVKPQIASIEVPLNK